MHLKLRFEIKSEYKSNNAIVNFVNNIYQLFDNNGTVLYGKRNTIKSFLVDDGCVPLEVVVKRYKKSDIVKQFIYTFIRDSKAKRAYLNAIELKRRNIQTPQAIAYVELSGKVLFKWGYYLSEADYSKPIEDKLIIPSVFDEQLAHDFACFVAELHQKGILHHDLNSTNVLFRVDDDREYRFSVIDINRMTFLAERQVPTTGECLDNLTRFTGRMDLFTFVLEHYIRARGWDVKSILPQAIAVKIKHDLNWKRRKAFFRMFKKKKH